MTEKTHSSSAIMWAVILVAVLLLLLVVPFAMTGKGPRPQANDEGREVRIQPVARVEIETAAAPTNSASGTTNKPRDGATIYSSVCVACHATGAAGAPKVGDKAAWAPRLAQGTATLIKNATTGKGAMPPKGGAADLSESEIKAAVEHLLKLTP